MTTPKAYSYLRFSTPEQAAGDSYRRQTSAALDYCSKHGLTLDEEVTYHDLGVSAFRGKNAETGRLGEFLEAVKEGLIAPNSFLLVESLDRISRQAARRALRVLEAICDEGITVVTLSDGKQYTREALDSDPMSLIMSLLIFIRSNEESAMKSRRLKAAWVGKRLKVAEGKPLTAKGPGWLKLDKTTGKWCVLEDRARVLVRIFKEASNGIGPHSIAMGLNKDQVPVFGEGKQWHRSYIIKLLDECPSVAGTYVPHVMEYVDGKKVRKPLEAIPNYFPRVVPEDLYQQVRAQRGTKSTSIRGSTKTIHNIFAGLVRCARCGASMTLQNKGAGNGPKYLVCSKARYGAGCKYTAVRYQEVEGFFLEASTNLLSMAPDKDDGKAGQELEALKVTIEKLEDRHSTLLDGYERTKDSAMLERLEEVKKELDGARERQRSLEGHIEATTGPLVAKRMSALKTLLNTKSKHLQRPLVNAAIKALFSGLSVNPDTGVATLAWNHGGTSEFVFGWPEEASHEG